MQLPVCPAQVQPACGGPGSTPDARESRSTGLRTLNESGGGGGGGSPSRGGSLVGECLGLSF